MAISLKTQNYPPAMNKNSRVNLVIVANLCSSNYTVGRKKKKKEISLFNTQLRLVTVCVF